MEISEQSPFENQVLPEKLSEEEEKLWLEWIMLISGKVSTGYSVLVKDLVFENPYDEFITIEDNKLIIDFGRALTLYEMYQRVGDNNIRILLRETKASYETYNIKRNVKRFFIEFSINRNAKTYDEYRESFKLTRTGSLLASPKLSSFKPFFGIGSFTKKAI